MEGCACHEDRERSRKQKSPYLCCCCYCCYDWEMSLCRWGRRRLVDLWAVSSSEDWRSERWRGGTRRRRGGSFSWFPWLSMEQNPSLIKRMLRRHLKVTFTPLPTPHFRNAMHDVHCHSVSRVTSLFLSVSFPSPFLCLRENKNALELLVDISHL